MSTSTTTTNTNTISSVHAVPELIIPDDDDPVVTENDNQSAILINPDSGINNNANGPSTSTSNLKVNNNNNNTTNKIRTFTCMIAKKRPRLNSGQSSPSSSSSAPSVNRSVPNIRCLFGSSTTNGRTNGSTTNGSAKAISNVNGINADDDEEPNEANGVEAVPKRQRELIRRMDIINSDSSSNATNGGDDDDVDDADDEIGSSDPDDEEEDDVDSSLSDRTIDLSDDDEERDVDADRDDANDGNASDGSSVQFLEREHSLIDIDDDDDDSVLLVSEDDYDHESVVKHLLKDILDVVSEHDDLITNLRKSSSQLQPQQKIEPSVSAFDDNHASTSTTNTTTTASSNLKRPLPLD